MSFILHRIAIVTIFYQICSLILAVLHYGLSVIPLPDGMANAIFMFETVNIPLLFSVLISFSMYLMMDHNTTAYIWFLELLLHLNLNHLCCCCCHRMAPEQLEQLQPSDKILNEPQIAAGITSDDKCQVGPQQRPRITETEFPNLSVNVQYTSDERREHSEDTVTYVSHSIDL